MIYLETKLQLIRTLKIKEGDFLVYSDIKEKIQKLF